MTALEKCKNSIVVPVVVIENADQAIPAAQALLAGGINVMEITLRTPAALQAINAVSEGCPDMMVGAGTVLNIDQCQEALAAGAKFIVSPGLDPETVAYCIDMGVPVIPGCVTPTEIMTAISLGVEVVKFFPANIYGGLAAMRNLAAPFGGIKFIPTGGVNTQNIKEYVDAPFVHAVGGSWICPKEDISAGNFARITQLCLEARGAAGK